MFEQTIDDPSFFYSSSTFSISVGGVLTASGGANRHNIKHLLRAYVSQPSQAAVDVNFVGAGIHKVTVVVDNVAESALKTCEVSVQVQYQYISIYLITMTICSSHKRQLNFYVCSFGRNMFFVFFS